MRPKPSESTCNGCGEVLALEQEGSETSIQGRSPLPIRYAAHRGPCQKCLLVGQILIGNISISVIVLIVI